MGLKREVGASGFPLLGDFHEDGGDEAEDGIFVWKEGCDAGAALDFAVEALGGVGSAQALACVFWQGEDGETFRDVLLHPRGELRGARAVFCDEFGEAGLGSRKVGRIKDRADVAADAAAHGDLGDVLLGVLLKMELAALPGGGIESGAQGCLEAFVGVGSHRVGNSDAALLEGVDKVAPVRLGFGECCGDA